MEIATLEGIRAITFYRQSFDLIVSETQTSIGECRKPCLRDMTQRCSGPESLTRAMEICWGSLSSLAPMARRSYWYSTCFQSCRSLIRQSARKLKLRMPEKSGSNFGLMQAARGTSHLNATLLRLVDLQSLQPFCPPHTLSLPPSTRLIPRGYGWRLRLRKG